MAKRIITDAKTGQVTVEEFTFVPPTPPTAEEILTEKQAAFDARITDDPLIEYMFDELAALKGTTKAEEKANAKAKIT